MEDDLVVGDLMRRYGAGEDSVFTELYNLMASRVYRFCMRLVGRKPEADDLFQETFLRIHRARATYMPGATVWHWVYAVARSVHLDRLRYHRRRPEDLGSTRDAAQHDWLRAPRGHGPEAEARARDLATVVTRELNRMSERNRVAYILLREEGLSVKEAAAVLGTTADVVKQRAHRAYAQLRTALGAAGWRDSVDQSWDSIPVRA